MFTTTIDFYLLNTVFQEDRYRFSCRLIDKAFLQHKKIFIQVNTAEEGQRFDELLWTFRDISFIPHRYLEVDSTIDPLLTIHIAVNKPVELHADILLNLSTRVPDYFSTFSRIIEVVSEENEPKNQSRQKYKFYKTQQCHLMTHHIN